SLRLRDWIFRWNFWRAVAVILISAVTAIAWGTLRLEQGTLDVQPRHAALADFTCRPMASGPACRFVPIQPLDCGRSFSTGVAARALTRRQSEDPTKLKPTGSYNAPVWIIALMVMAGAYLFSRIDPTQPLAGHALTGQEARSTC